jgi:thiosulfate sulfurtransferase
MQNDPTATSMSAEQLALFVAKGTPVSILDVRRAAAVEKNPVRIPGALRVPPEEVSEWAARNASAKGVPVVTYCVHGHEVSQGAAAALRTSGFTASYLEGGIGEWEKQGRGIQSNDA